MANTSISLVNLDFNDLKEGFKTYLKGQSQFKDYDYEGSNISVLLDVLAYNSYLNAFYLNMLSNEMFLDTARLRDNVVSRAKELNYVPRSFQSAKAQVVIEITTPEAGQPGAVGSVTIPARTEFISRIDNTNFVFTTDQDTIATGADNIKTTDQIFIYEGAYATDTFTYTGDINQRFILSNPTIDTTSLVVTVEENNGLISRDYLLTNTLFGKDNTSEIYFLQMADSEKYEIVFGDGVSGRKPLVNSRITAAYRVTSGELPNGATKFESAGSIAGFQDVNVIVKTPAASGSVSESIESIKYNAPRYFTSQERAITAEDYSALLKLNFPEINTVNAYGGEDADPPQYGKVYVAIDLQSIDGVPEVKKREYYNFLKPRCSLSIDPVIVEPSYTYVAINTLVRFNINLTGKSSQNIKNLVFAAIQNYNNTSLNNFNRSLRYSSLVRIINDVDPSVISNDTDLKIVKYINPLIGFAQTYNINFGQELESDFSVLEDNHTADYKSIISSSYFFVEGQRVIIEDDGLGGLYLVISDITGLQQKQENILTNDELQGFVDLGLVTHRRYKKIGTINYNNGSIVLNNLAVQSIENDVIIKIYALPKYKDIFSSKTSILRIADEDINVTISAERE